MYECFHCGARAVIWDADFDLSDYGIDGEGVIHERHCESCGAEITYVVKLNDEDESDDEAERNDEEKRDDNA